MLRRNYQLSQGNQPVQVNAQRQLQNNALFYNMFGLFLLRIKFKCSQNKAYTYDSCAWILGMKGLLREVSSKLVLNAFNCCFFSSFSKIFQLVIFLSSHIYLRSILCFLFLSFLRLYAKDKWWWLYFHAISWCVALTELRNQGSFLGFCSFVLYKLQSKYWGPAIMDIVSDCTLLLL